MTSATPFLPTPWVRRLLVLNVAVYLLSLTVLTGPWFYQTVAFSPAGAAGRPWTFVTHLFAHAGMLHLAVNMLMLLMFGPGVERRMGSGAFLRYYLLCGLGGPATALALAVVVRGVTPFVGAAAAVFGVALAFAVYWPQARVYIFPLPWALPVPLLVGVLAALALTPVLFDTRDGIGHLAQLGGFLFGFIYLKSASVVERHADRPVSLQSEAPALVAHQAGAAAADMPSAKHPRVAGPGDDVAGEMDRLLEKIWQQGLSSLTAAERRFLDEMSRQMRGQ